MKLGYLIGKFIEGRGDVFGQIIDIDYDDMSGTFRTTICSSDSPELYTDYGLAKSHLDIVNKYDNKDIFGFGNEAAGNFKLYVLNLQAFQFDKMPRPIFDQHIFDLMKGSRY